VTRVSEKVEKAAFGELDRDRRRFRLATIVREGRFEGGVSGDEDLLC
jgi:hypothetical protein